MSVLSEGVQSTTFVLKLYNVVENALFTIQDCNDLWLSDLKELESAHWGVKNLWAIGSELESMED